MFARQMLGHTIFSGLKGKNNFGQLLIIEHNRADFVTISFTALTECKLTTSAPVFALLIKLYDDTQLRLVVAIISLSRSETATI